MNEVSRVASVSKVMEVWRTMVDYTSTSNPNQSSTSTYMYLSWPELYLAAAASCTFTHLCTSRAHDDITVIAAIAMMSSCALGVHVHVPWCIPRAHDDITVIAAIAMMSSCALGVYQECGTVLGDRDSLGRWDGCCQGWCGTSKVCQLPPVSGVYHNTTSWWRVTRLVGKEGRAYLTSCGSAKRYLGTHITLTN